ncbi:MAG: universal stress protein [Deltaproteobacteria bacterium]|jgi:nucleotide-binding universal stress UspA family protein|nr:universal stress protein [Deltaproteobacteria bacterium]
MSTKGEKAMSAEIRRILCATDLSGNCNHIYSCAMNLASERDASLMIIHVLSQRSIKAAKTLACYLNESQKDVVKEKAYCVLQRMKEELSSFLKKEIKNHPEYPDLVEHLLVYPGKVAEEIVEKANRFGCDAIVLGPHRSNFVKRFFTGGTANNVLKRTKKPVFLVSVKHGKKNISNYNRTRTGQSQKSVNNHESTKGRKHEKKT